MDTSKLLKSMQQQATQLVTPTFQRLFTQPRWLHNDEEARKKLYIFFSARIFQTAWLFLENSKMSGLCLLLLWISNIVLLCKLHFRQPAKIKSFHRQVAFYFVAWIMPNQVHQSWILFVYFDYWFFASLRWNEHFCKTFFPGLVT